MYFIARPLRTEAVWAKPIWINEKEHTVVDNMNNKIERVLADDSRPVQETFQLDLDPD